MPDPGKQPVENSVKEAKAYIVTNFRITYNEYSWSEGDELVDDKSKIPSAEVTRLLASGSLTPKE